ncbi:thiol-disulfide oxidoreductase DCC family protein [Aequorivita marina]|uniref:thiol-disulfide oxidoreductase DCC family protein n=1 Tax=Aequorivita marina TaxID=3073654 RepID=UPI002874AD84|nr:DCC1-like thiol-disulfide oxidoreductase family protein [Aequorivita sp. S2608]MDS1298364.1 DCC1-like thiol-disulfide oxidoreductase family protein [Aequorivita sp. S2608]
MFTKVPSTSFSPSKPLLVWDGACGFCKYWVTHWKFKTGNRVNYSPYQEVAHLVKGIPIKEFKKASRLIETDGSIYSGPNSAYRSFVYFKKPSYFWNKLYARSKTFTFISDHSYNFIAKHRSFFFKLTTICFGKNPKSLKPYWLLWICTFGLSIIMIVSIL